MDDLKKFIALGKKGIRSSKLLGQGIIYFPPNGKFYAHSGRTHDGIPKYKIFDTLIQARIFKEYIIKENQELEFKKIMVNKEPCPSCGALFGRMYCGRCHSELRKWA